MLLTDILKMRRKGENCEILELKYMKYLKKRCAGEQMILLFKK